MGDLDVSLNKYPDGGALDLEGFSRKSWPGISALSVKIAAPASYRFKLKNTSGFVALRDLFRVEGETAVRGSARSSLTDLRGKLAFIPAGSEVVGWARIEKAASYFFVMIDDIALGRRAADLSRFPTLLEFDDQTVRSLVLRFQAILSDPSLDVPGYAETLAELLTFELFRVCGGAQPEAVAPGGLAPSQMRLITEYMDSNLAEKVAISDLAALVGLTRFHFMRAFKQAAGVPPFQFMIRRRVDRAKELLAERRLSIPEVASRTGFGSPIQMTRAFRRVVGATPSAIRRGN